MQLGRPRPENRIKLNTFLTPFLCQNFNVSTEDEITHIKTVNRLLLVIYTIIFFAAELLAGPQDHGRDYSVEDSDSSNVPFWFIIVTIGAGILGFNLLKNATKDKKNEDSNGCIGAIIGVVVVFVIIYLLNH